ncbi:MAG: hypothetical protein HOQ05_05980 [Corynebacteriales bacterium]|nr:hypothetical protein [Mycobacteriales bacterium]
MTKLQAGTLHTSIASKRDFSFWLEVCQVDKDMLNFMGAAAVGLALLLGFWPEEKQVDGDALKCGSPFSPKEPPLVKQIGIDGSTQWVETNSFAQKYCSDEMSGRRTAAIIAGVGGLVCFAGAAGAKDDEGGSKSTT